MKREIRCGVCNTVPERFFFDLIVTDTRLSKIVLGYEGYLTVCSVECAVAAGIMGDSREITGIFLSSVTDPEQWISFVTVNQRSLIEFSPLAILDKLTQTNKLLDDIKGTHTRSRVDPAIQFVTKELKSLPREGDDER